MTNSNIDKNKFKGKHSPQKKKVEDPREEDKNEEYKQKSIKVYKKTDDLAEELKFETRAKSKTQVYEKAIEFYAQHFMK